MVIEKEVKAGLCACVSLPAQILHAGWVDLHHIQAIRTIRKPVWILPGNLV